MGGNLQRVYLTGQELLLSFMCTLLTQASRQPCEVFLPPLHVTGWQIKAQKVTMFMTPYLVNSRSGILAWFYLAPNPTHLP